MSTQVKAGVFCVVDGVGQVANWQVNDLLSRNTFRTSGTVGGTGRVEGVEDFNGSLVHLGGIPLLMPGDYFDFVGFTGPDTGTPGDTGDTFAGEALVEQVQVVWDWATNNLIRTTINFGGNEALVPGTGVYTDAVLPPLTHKPKGLWLRAGAMATAAATIAADAAAKFLNTTTATLTITRAAQTHVDSETNGATGRIPGAADWTLSVVQNRLTRALMDKGDIKHLVLPVNATQYWSLKWGIAGDVTGINADNESNAILAQTTLIEMYGEDATSGDGSITLPGAGAAWWPFT